MMAKKVDWILKIKQQLIKEEVQGEIELAHIEPDFFSKLNQYRTLADKKELDVIDPIVNQIIRMRVGKLLGYIERNDSKDFHDLLSDEEYQFWETVQQAQCVLLTKVLRYGN